MRFTTAIIALFVIGMFSGTSRAEIIHFTNPAPGEPGHYDWHYEATDGWASWLDITRGPDQQTNTMNGNSISQSHSVSIGPTNAPFFSPGQTAQFLCDAEGWVTYAWALEQGEEVNQHLGLKAWGNSGILAHVPEDETIYSRFNEQYRYIGVRTLSGQRGWIEVVRDGMNLTAVAWAYEVEPGVPIYAGQVPAPGALALLAISAFAPTSRRRRA
jgi:hypothetical protein